MLQITEITDAGRTATTADERALLLAASKQWFDAEGFSDEQVAEVKGIFRRVFQLEEEEALQGLLFKDALVMTTPRSDETVRYAMVVVASAAEDIALEWIKVTVTPASFQILAPSLITFDDFISILGSSQARLMPSEEEEDSDRSICMDFFLFWKRKYSPERIARVAQKGTPARDTTSERIPRTEETIARMKLEMRLLGCEEYYTNDSSTQISGIWVDEDKEMRGFAPMSFTISLVEGDDGSSGEDDAEEKRAEGGAGRFGVFIDEVYGPGAILIDSWAKWENWVKECIKP
jgi:hypothetical protein